MLVSFLIPEVWWKAVSWCHYMFFPSALRKLLWLNEKRLDFDILIQDLWSNLKQKPSWQQSQNQMCGIWEGRNWTSILKLLWNWMFVFQNLSRFIFTENPPSAKQPTKMLVIKKVSKEDPAAAFSAAFTSPVSHLANGNKATTIVPSVYKNLVPKPAAPPSKVQGFPVKLVNCRSRENSPLTRESNP